jgi:hypothetical protein
MRSQRRHAFPGPSSSLWALSRRFVQFRAAASDVAGIARDGSRRLRSAMVDGGHRCVDRCERERAEEARSLQAASAEIGYGDFK